MAVSRRMTPRIAIRNLSFLGVILGSAVSVPAAQLKEAQVTQVVKGVKLLPTGAAARAAAGRDEGREGDARRTGVDPGESRTNDHHADGFENDSGAGRCRYWQDHAKLTPGHWFFNPAR